MPQNIHNPGLPHRLVLDDQILLAFSIAGLSTYLLLPRLNCAFDMGDCLLEALPLKHVFITHAHGDHCRCLLRHHALRCMMNMDNATYYVPQPSLAGFLGLAKAWAKLEQMPAQPPNFKGLENNDEVLLHQQLLVRAFAVDHTLPSLGYTVFQLKKKLKPAYQHCSSQELATLRKQAVPFEDEHQTAKLTFIGDCTEETLYQYPQLGEATILLLELTFLMDNEISIAKKRGHLHIDQLARFLKQYPQRLANKHIVLKHFSMRYSSKQIKQQIQKKLPPEFTKRIHLLI